jgi:hypothetical protein
MMFLLFPALLLYLSLSFLGALCEQDKFYVYLRDNSKYYAWYGKLSEVKDNAQICLTKESLLSPSTSMYMAVTFNDIQIQNLYCPISGKNLSLDAAKNLPENIKLRFNTSPFGEPHVRSVSLKKADKYTWKVVDNNISKRDYVGLALYSKDKEFLSGFHTVYVPPMTKLFKDLRYILNQFFKTLIIQERRTNFIERIKSRLSVLGHPIVPLGVSCFIFIRRPTLLTGLVTFYVIFFETEQGILPDFLPILKFFINAFNEQLERVASSLPSTQLAA